MMMMIMTAIINENNNDKQMKSDRPMSQAHVTDRYSVEPQFHSACLVFVSELIPHERVHVSYNEG